MKDEQKSNKELISELKILRREKENILKKIHYILTLEDVPDHMAEELDELLNGYGMKSPRQMVKRRVKL